MNDPFAVIEISDVDAVLIDLDDTLYNYQRAHAAALRQCGERFYREYPHWQHSVDFARQYRAGRDQVTRRLRGQGACRSRLLAFQVMFETLQLPRAFQHAVSYAELYWSALIASAEPFPAAEAFLRRCRSAAKPVCVVTDMLAAVQIRKLEKLQLSGLVDFLVTSEEVGAEKPARSIFLHALEKLGLPADRVIMIGDDLEKDIRGAEACGIRAYQVSIGLPAESGDEC